MSAKHDEWQAMIASLPMPAAALPPVQSPCVRLCVMGEAGHCIGCGRTLEEIAGWGSMSEATRRQVVTRAAERLAQENPAPTAEITPARA